MNASKINRMCIINKENGFISVDFIVSEFMMSGAEFKITIPLDLRGKKR